MDESDVKELLEAIEEVTRCPICLEPVRAPISQCLNGHGMCSRCKGSLSKCTLCKQPFVETPPRMLEQLLEILHKPCGYSDKGCTALLVLDSHSKYCEYRPIKCKVGEVKVCSWTGTVSEWIHHVHSVHSTYSCAYPLNVTKNWNYPNVKSFCGSVHFVDNNTFLHFIYKSNGVFHQSVRHVPCKKPNSIYYFEITLKKNSEVLYRSLLKATPLLENELHDICSMGALCEDIECLINTEGRLPIEFRVIKKSLD